ncbi:MAG TPA: hypothetical protein VFE62_12470 [Gemmataceae bacterium]|nr:hypothetical protein [Gemmataceae bacterium]
MATTGPPLARLLHRLAECPPDFLLPVGDIDVVALACDHLRALDVSIPGAKERRTVASLSNEMRRLVPIVLWLLRDDWFLIRPELAKPTWALLHSEALSKLAKLVRVEAIVGDPDRREELVRICLNALDLVPEGESSVQAADRLTTLDSVERERVIRETRKAEARAREIREAMAKKRAEEAAARYSRE